MAMREATESRLASARLITRTIASSGEMSLEEGYRIGAELEAQRMAAGGRRIGWKLGFTNMALWPTQGVNGPFRAPVYSDTLIVGRIVTNGLVQPRIEPEIVVGLKLDLPPGGDLLEVAAAIDWAAPALEVVECHFEGWKMTAAGAVADAGLHAGLCIGPRTTMDPASALDLAHCTCEFIRDGTLIDRGLAATALGEPVSALVWLLKALPVDLRAGDVVTTGSMIGATPVAPGQHWTNRIHGIVDSTVELTFT